MENKDKLCSLVFLKNRYNVNFVKLNILKKFFILNLVQNFRFIYFNLTEFFIGCELKMKYTINGIGGDIQCPLRK